MDSEKGTIDYIKSLFEHSSVGSPLNHNLVKMCENKLEINKLTVVFQTN